MSDSIIDPEQIRELNDALEALNKTAGGFTTTFDKSKTSVDKGLKSTDKFAQTLKKLGDELNKFSGQIARATKDQAQRTNEAKKTTASDKSMADSTVSLSRSFNSLQASTVKLDNAFKNLSRSVGGGGAAAANKAGGLVNQVLSGGKNGSTHANGGSAAIGELMKTFGKLSGAVGRISSLFSMLGKFTGPVALLLGAVNALVDYNKIIVKTYDDLNEFGGSLGISSDELNNLANQAGYTTHTMDKMVSSFKKYSTTLAMMGSTVSEGIKSFAVVAEVPDSVRTSFRKLGISSEELTEYQLQQVDHMAKMGISMPKTTAGLEKLRKITLEKVELDSAITAMTGKTRDEMQRGLDRMKADDAFKIYTRGMQLRGGEEAKFADRLVSLNTVLAKTAPTIADGVRDISAHAGVAMTEEGKRLMAVTNGAIIQWVKQVERGDISADQLRQKVIERRDAYMHNRDTNSTLRNSESFRKTMGLYGEALDETIQQSGKKLTDGQNEVDAAKNRKDPRIDTVAALQNAELKAHKALDTLAGNISNKVMPAMSWFAKGLANIATFLPGTGDMDMSIFDTKEDLTKQIAEKTKDMQMDLDIDSRGSRTRARKTKKEIDDLNKRLAKLDTAGNASATTPSASTTNVNGATAQSGSSQNQVQIKDKSGNVTENREGGTISWRNNNPGNLRMGKFAMSKGAIGENGGFAVFPDMATGEEARKSLLFETSTYKDLTLSAAISKYAPSSENNTGAYISAVAKAVGVSPNTKLSELNASQRSAMLGAMKKHEGFKAGTVNSRSSPVASLPMTNQSAVVKPDASKQLAKDVPNAPVDTGTKATDKKTTGDVHASIEDLIREQKNTNSLLDKIYKHQAA